LAKELPRETYLAKHVFDACLRLTAFYDQCHEGAVPELERLGRTVARWETPILHWHRARLTNAAAEGTNSSSRTSNDSGRSQTGLEVELTGHLGYERHAVAGRRSGNSR